LKRREIKSWVDAGGAPDAVSKGGGRDESIETIVARFAKSRSGADIGRDTTIDELGLSSLERVELLMALEDRFQTTLDEAAYAEVKTVGDLHLLVAEAVGGAVGRDDSSLHAEDFAAADVAILHATDS